MKKIAVCLLAITGLLSSYSLAFAEDMLQPQPVSEQTQNVGHSYDKKDLTKQHKQCHHHKKWKCDKEGSKKKCGCMHDKKSK